MRWKVSLIQLKPIPIEIPMDEIAAFYRRHPIRRLALFGSILREDFSLYAAER